MTFWQVYRPYTDVSACWILALDPVTVLSCPLYAMLILSYVLLMPRVGRDYCGLQAEHVQVLTKLTDNLA